MERKLSVESRQEFDTNLKNLLNPLANLLNKKNVKLNGEGFHGGCVLRVSKNAWGSALKVWVNQEWPHFVVLKILLVRMHLWIIVLYALGKLFLG